MKERHPDTYPLIFEMEEPEELTPRKLDHYLATGWDRDAEFLFRQNVTFLGGQICSIVPLRVVLADYKPSKSQQKILKKCKDFTYEIRPLEVDEEKEKLYQKHRMRFKEYVRQTLKDFFYRYANQSAFPTWELCVYDEHKLIAASFIDIGHHSVYSIYGMFDTDYSAYSLGKCTMLLELDYCKRNNKAYYYPGHAVDVSSMYDYKMTFEGMQYFDWRGHWKPLSNLPHENTYVRVLKDRLQKLKDAIWQQLGLSFKMEQNRDFFTNVWELLGIQKTGQLHGPLFLSYHDGLQTFSAEFRADQGYYLLYLGKGHTVLYWGNNFEMLITTLQSHRKRLEDVRQLVSFRLIELETFLSGDTGMPERLSLTQTGLMTSVESMFCLYCQGDKNRYTIEYAWGQDRYYVYINLSEQNQRHVFHFSSALETVKFIKTAVKQEQRDFLVIKALFSKYDHLQLKIKFQRSDFYATTQLLISNGGKKHILKYSIPDQIFVLEVTKSASMLYFIKGNSPEEIVKQAYSLIEQG